MMDQVKINVAQSPGVLAIFVDYGFGPRLSASIPTGDQAAYPEAIERNQEEANRKLREHLTGLLAQYPGATLHGAPACPSPETGCHSDRWSRGHWITCPEAHNG